MYYSPERTKNSIVVYLSPGQPAPAVPFEISSQVSADTWTARINALQALMANFSKPLFERIWLAISILAMFAVPLVVLSALYNTEHNGMFPHPGASGVGLALFLAVGSVVLLPLVIWKYTGQKRANALLQHWVQSDRLQYAQNTPNWKVQIPGVFNNKAILTLMLPFSLTTVFHPDAYLPAYINAPNDVDAVYYYPFKGQGQAGLPRMSVVGNVPLYADEKRGFADYKV